MEPGILSYFKQQNFEMIDKFGKKTLMLVKFFLLPAALKVAKNMATRRVFSVVEKGVSKPA